MRNKIIASVFTVTVFGGLAVACAAGPDGGHSDETVDRTTEDLSSCVAFLPAATTTPYVPNDPDCPGRLGIPKFDASPPYGTSSCSYYAVELQGTTANASGSFVAGVWSPGTTQAECANAVLEVAVYGFESTVNPAVYPIPGWQPITSVTVNGTWSGGGCEFPGAQSIAFNDTVPTPGPHDLTRYQDLIVYTEAHTTTTVKNRPVTSFLPVEVTLGQPGCQ